ncbi:hypothetical protein PIB30_021562 [Stylosanthes scabra]|uniref:Uncharacterized protein n=1 Tax=Stylosanthes scabra TaxID=79078 RepID=A0ABU6S9M4_9FABA|nr:hypothetical protein [Stylosanthes scabra]
MVGANCSGVEVRGVRSSEDLEMSSLGNKVLGQGGEQLSFHENLQCSFNLQGTAGGGPARPLRHSSAIGKGPSISIPHLQKGQLTSELRKSSVRRCIISEWRWQLSHVLTFCMQSALSVGQ